MSLESQIGSQWLNRIGIVAVLIGVPYFLRHAFENDWVGPAGQVALGLLAGISVVLWSERFRTHGYLAFSWSLLSGSQAKLLYYPGTVIRERSHGLPCKPSSPRRFETGHRGRTGSTIRDG